MKRTFYILAVLTGIIICSCTSNVPTVIQGSLTNIEDSTITIELGKDPITGLVPENYQKVYEIRGDGTFTIPIESSLPFRAVLYSENHAFFTRINLVHRGEIKVTADCSDIKNTLEFQGASAGLNTFSRDLENYKWYVQSNIQANFTSLSDYENSLDSLQTISLKLLDDFHTKNPLSKEERHWLASNIIYGKYTSLNRQAFRMNTPLNDSSYQFFQSLNLNDQEAILVSRTYVEAILDYLLYMVNSSGIFHSSFNDNSSFFKYYYETLIETLDGKVRDVLLTNFVIDMMKNFNVLSEEYYEHYLTDCTSSEMLESARPLYENYLRIISEPLSESVNLISTNQQSPMEVLGKFENKVVLMDFWASWCSPCIRALPHTEELAEHYRDQEVMVLYIGNLDQRNNLLNAIKKHKLTGNHIILDEEETGDWRNEFAIRGIPNYVVIDKAGKVIHQDNPHQISKETYVLIDSLLSVQ